jgi:hypothetical protein
MRARTSSTSRAAFTLLEVILSTAIGIMLMGGLYVAMSVSLHQAQAGRDVVEHSLLVRTLLWRMGNDIRVNIVPPMPASATSSSSSSGSGGSSSGGSGSSGSTSGSTGTTGSTMSSSTGTSSTMSGSTSSSTGSTTSSSSSTTTNTVGAVQYWGVQGQTNQLTIFTSRLPMDVINSYLNPATSANPMLGSDLRRIDYWIGSNADGTGLCRKEFNTATSTDAMTMQLADPNTDPLMLVAEEVRSLQFRYWDGTEWLDTWDSTQPGLDGVTQQGPPLAIEITISIPKPGIEADKAGEQNLQHFRHVVSIPAGNGTTTQPQITTVGPSGTTTGN